MILGPRSRDKELNFINFSPFGASRGGLVDPPMGERPSGNQHIASSVGANRLSRGGRASGFTIAAMVDGVEVGFAAVGGVCIAVTPQWRTGEGAGAVLTGRCGIGGGRARGAGGGWVEGHFAAECGVIEGDAGSRTGFAGFFAGRST
jgi:hypothetical protein